MHPDLERLISLQRIESERDAARRALEGIPARREALEASVADQQAAVDAAKQRAADNTAERRAIEKDLSAVQTRLRRYKDQLMEVKTNKEYTAMQHEIATAEQEVRRFEDQLLEKMVEADELAAGAKASEAALARARIDAATEARALDAEAARWQAQIEQADASRETVAAQMAADVLALFETIRARRGTAVVEARDGHCSVCHVRLRPQQFNEIRRNETIIQCESCQRILYFAAAAGPQAPPA